MPTTFVQLRARNDGALVPKFAGVDYGDKLMIVTLTLSAMSSACIACLICAFLRRRRQGRTELVSNQFYNAEYERSDVFDTTQSASQSCIRPSKFPPPPSTPFLPSGQPIVPRIQGPSGAKRCADKSMDNFVMNTNTSHDAESFYSQCHRRDLDGDRKLHQLDSGLLACPPLLEQTHYTSIERHSLKSPISDVKQSIVHWECFDENRHLDQSPQYVNQTSIQTEDHFESNNLYSKLHAQNRQLTNPYMDVVKIYSKQNEPMFNLDKGKQFPDGEKFKIYDDEKDFCQGIYGNVDARVSIDGGSEDISTEEISMPNECLGRGDTYFNGKVVAEVKTIDDNDDASSTSHDLYVNSDLGIVRDRKTMSTECSSDGGSWANSSGGKIDDDVLEEGYLNSISNEMYIHYDSWKDSSNEKQSTNGIQSWICRQDNYKKEVSSAGNTVGDVMSEVDEEDKSSNEDDLYLNLEVWNASVHKNKMAIHDKDNKDSSATCDNRFIKHVMDSSNMSDTSSNSEVIYFETDIPTTANVGNETFEQAHGIDCKHDITDIIGNGNTVGDVMSEVDEEDKSSNEDGLYLNLDVWNASVHKNKMAIHDKDNKDSSATCDNRFIKHVMDSSNMSDTSSNSEVIYFETDIPTMANVGNETFEQAHGIDCKHDITDIIGKDLEEDDNSFEIDDIYTNSDIFRVDSYGRGKSITGATSSQSLVSDSVNGKSNACSAWSIPNNKPELCIEAEGGSVDRTKSCSEDSDNVDGADQQRDNGLEADDEVIDEQNYYINTDFLRKFSNGDPFG